MVVPRKILLSFKEYQDHLLILFDLTFTFIFFLNFQVFMLEREREVMWKWAWEWERCVPSGVLVSHFVLTCGPRGEGTIHLMAYKVSHYLSYDRLSVWAIRLSTRTSSTQSIWLGQGQTWYLTKYLSGDVGLSDRAHLLWFWRAN